MQMKNTFNNRNQTENNEHTVSNEKLIWVCPVDEHVNPWSAEICPLCGRRREECATPTILTTPPAGEKWRCPRCESINEATQQLCKVCSFDKSEIDKVPLPLKTWKCSNCGFDRNKEEISNCYKCGKPRYPTEHRVIKKWRCPVCDTWNGEKVAICGTCGTPRGESWTCKHCGHSNAIVADFCVNCGKPKKTTKNSKIAWIVAAIIAIIIIIIASSSGNQTDSTQNKTQIRATPTPTARSTQAPNKKEKIGATPTPTATASQKAGSKQLDVARTDSEYLRENQQSATFYLTTPIKNCTYLKMELTVTECSGFPYGNWYLYAKDLSDHWNHIEAFRIEKDVVMGRLYTYVFRFSDLQSFKALAITMQDRGNEYSITYDLSFYTG